MNDPKLDLLIKEKIQKYVPPRPVQVMHGGVIVLVSIAIGVLSLPSGEDAARNGLESWLGLSLAATGLILYTAWTVLRIDKARKEAHKEFITSVPEKKNKRK